jgi:hypothetical protein
VISAASALHGVVKRDAQSGIANQAQFGEFPPPRIGEAAYRKDP